MSNENTVTTHLNLARKHLAEAQEVIRECWPKHSMNDSLKNLTLQVGGRAEHWKAFPGNAEVALTHLGVPHRKD